MNVYTMPGMADMGMVWMGAGQTSDMSIGLMSTDSNEMLMDQDTYYQSSHHSASNHSLDDIPQLHSSPMTMDGLEMLNMADSNDSSYTEEDSPVFMITTATQTLPCPTRKIKPVKHPGLVLKTPIAYQGNTDPSVIPIQKDGMAVCQKCGAIGVKHAFYTRERRFCSMACARGYSGLIPETLPQHSSTQTQDFAHHEFKIEDQDDLEGYHFDSPFPQIANQEEEPDFEENIKLIRSKRTDIANSYDWDPDLTEDSFLAAPVTCFPAAPMMDIWDNILVGMKVEVENMDCDNVSEAFPDSFWVASVVRIVGYKALLRYEGFGLNTSKDFWVSFCSNQVHPVGWCASIGKPLIPPKTIENKYSDWKEFLRKRLTGARTLPSNFANKVSDALKSRFKCGTNLEVVDKNRISQVKVAMIHKIVGKRLNVKYYDMTPEDTGFWCHEDSPLLHPVGWAKRVGHNIVAPVNYFERVNAGMFDEDDATDNLFKLIQVGTVDKCTEFIAGMKLEAIDPLNLSSICAATVMDVLNCGYIMIRIDTYDSDATGADWFCYHKNSPCIFPVGFCRKNHISLTPPKGYDPATFNWRMYLQHTQTVPISESLINQHIPEHGFKDGMKIEAADLMDPRLVCVATVAKVVGRLLKVHFDGWEEEYDQWLDCASPDIYPLGWCSSVGHKLEGPPVVQKPVLKGQVPIKGLKRKGRKKKVKDSPPKPPIHKTIKRDEVQINPTKIEGINEDADVEIEDLPEPEPASEPVGPDQSMPVSTEPTPTPPPERKATSYIAATNNSNTGTKLIPRLIDSTGGTCDSSELCPNNWNVFDVAQFLRVNDCANYCDNFKKQRITGKALMELSKEDILEYTGRKVGPSLKIFDLVQQLKMKVYPSQTRHLKANIKKYL